MSSLEGVLTRMREAQNFSFWILGAFYCLLQSMMLPPATMAMADQLFKSLQIAMVDQAKDSAFAVASVKALCRESYLSYLPPSFKTATKVLLRQSSID